MPSQYPQAQFVPISPDLDLNALVEKASNFDYVTRLPREMLKEHSPQSLEQLVLLHVVIGGKPLVIEGWESSLPPWLFSPSWLQENLGKKPQTVRDVPNGVDIQMTMSHYLKSMDQLTKQFTASNFRLPKHQRLYLKDIDTPDLWAEHLRNVIPEPFFYLNDCIESRTGGDGAILEPNEYSQMRHGKGVAPAGDLMSSLPPEMQALNMMCYIGHEGTYTPAHREMCASLGHNIMVETSEEGKGERPGSSIWFMTETKEREVVSEYFLSMLGHDIEVEKHFAQLNAWKKAPFNVWVVEQKVGDLILIPPLAPHQVWNRGTRTMKAAWNRTTVDTLELAIREALPRGRMVCRDEQYKNKAIIYYTLMKYHSLLQRNTVEPKMWRYGRIKQLQEDFKRLFSLFSEILISEMFSSDLPIEKNVEFLPFDSNVTCSYCRCNIFNRFLTCKTCIEVSDAGEEDTYDICMDCYAMGRSCACISNLVWVEQWEWSVLTQNYELWRNVVVQYDGYYDVNTSSQPLDIARRCYGKKPVAQVCQEQLRIRPWNDITTPATIEPSPGWSDDEPEVDDEGRLKRKRSRRGRKGRVGAVKNKTRACHSCGHHEWNWKLASCTTCSSAYCFGVLWRAFDLMPQQVLADTDWQCPKCLKMCSCARCRKSSTQIPYSPRGTLLGHDTRKVADCRSVESLVDFSKTNLGWLKDENDNNPQESARMKRLKKKAAVEKAREDAIDESYLDDGRQPTPPAHGLSQGHREIDDMADIDPQLRDITSFLLPHEPFNGQHQPTDPAALSESHHCYDGVGIEKSNDNFDGHEGLGDLHSREASRYPPALVGIMVDSESSYPGPSHLGQNRMMGIGYYQQGNGIDKILYHPPSSDTPARRKENLAVQEILKTQPQAGSKRKRQSLDRPNIVNEDGSELLISSNRKNPTRAKRLSGMNIEEDQHLDVVAHKTQSKRELRQTRRSTGKPGPLTNPDEEMADRLESDRELSLRSSSRVEIKDEAELDNERLAKEVETGQVNGLLQENAHKQATSSKEGRIRGTARRVAPVAMMAINRTSGKPAEQLSKISSNSRSLISKETTRLSLPPESPLLYDEDDGGVRIDDDFGMLSETVSTTETPGRINRWRDSEHNSSVRITEAGYDKEKTVASPSVKLATVSGQEEPKDIPGVNLLSIKEKLALKGKSCKIVAAKPPQSIGPSSGMITPSLNKSLTNRSTIVSSRVLGNVSNKSQPASTGAVESPLMTYSNLSSSGSELDREEPIRKGPTIVRLMSSEAESKHSENFEDLASFSSSSDDDESISAVRPVPRQTRGRVSLKASVSSNGKTSFPSMRGRPKAGRL